MRRVVGRRSCTSGGGKESSFLEIKTDWTGNHTPDLGDAATGSDSRRLAVSRATVVGAAADDDDDDLLLLLSLPLSLPPLSAAAAATDSVTAARRQQQQQPVLWTARECRRRREIPLPSTAPHASVRITARLKLSETKNKKDENGFYENTFPL